eukprot:6113-Eustigmatos_ZCMA.PRE.1
MNALRPGAKTGAQRVTTAAATVDAPMNRLRSCVEMRDRIQTPPTEPAMRPAVIQIAPFGSSAGRSRHA